MGIGINATKLLHRIGIGDAVNAIVGHRNGVWISFRRYDTGEDIITVPVNDRERVRQCPVHRAELLALLVEEIERRRAARLHTSKQCWEVVVSIYTDKYRQTGRHNASCICLHVHRTTAPT